MEKDTPPPTSYRATVTLPPGSSQDALTACASTDVSPTSGWTLPSPVVALSAMCFGDYEVIGEIGEGGMGRVYKAVDRKLGRHVALKVLRSMDPFEANRFRGEAELYALLDHPNIIKIYSIDATSESRPYIALEFAEGGSLDRELAGRPIEPRRAAEMAEVMARAIHYAHSKGVIHRDLKPGNVLRTKDSTLKITDFGLAKQLEVSSGMTPTGAVMGTPSYMAPEQAEGKVKTLGPQTDVYGLGAILYEMLTGRPPFRGTNLVETLEQVRWTEPTAPSQIVPRLHRDLSTICLKCLRKTPGQRYATAGELADDLRHWLNGETIVARSASNWERVWRQVKRRPWQTATVLVSAIVAVLLVFGAIYLEAQHRKETFQAELDAQNKLAQQEKEQSLKLIADTELKSAAKLRKRSNETLVALDSIREMMLRGELRNVSGLTPLRNNLFVYYKRLNAELIQEGDYDKFTLAKSWLEVGKLIQETGQKNDALESFKEANKLFKTIALDNLESRVNRAEAEGKCGRLAFELNMIKEAKESCDAVEKLLTGFDDNRKCAGELAEMWHLRGELFDRERGADLDATLARTADAYDKAIAFREKALGNDLNLSVERFIELAKQDPARFKLGIENLRGLARDHAYQAGVRVTQNAVGSADKSYWEAHSIRDKVRKIMRPVAATSDEYLTDHALAESHYSRGPSNCAWVQTYCRALATGKYFALDALELRRKVCDANPNNLEFRRDLYYTINVVVDLKLMLGEYDDSIPALLDEAVKVPKDLADNEGSYSVEALGILATAHLLRAEFYGYKPNPDVERAKTERKLATTYLDDLLKKNPSDPVAMFNSALNSAMRADLITQTGVNIDRLKVDFQNDSMAALEQAIKLGYRDKHPSDIREMRAFEKLKAVPRFIELLDKLRAAREPRTVRTSTASP